MSLTPARPLILIPGYLGSLPDTQGLNRQQQLQALEHFLWNRGTRSSELAVVEPYQELANFLEGQGYVPGQTLFTLPYDWRIPLALDDGQEDAFLSRVTAEQLTNGTLEAQVDALGALLKQLSDGDPSLSEVDIIAHSNGNNVTRAYIQSAGYGGAYTDQQGARRLPTIGTLIQLAPPSEGAAAAWNIWNDNLISLKDFGGAATKDLVNGLKLVYSGVKSGLAKVKGPDQVIDQRSIRDPGQGGEPSSRRFMQQYFASLRTLLPTYNFLSDRQGEQTNINGDPSARNTFLLDLNARSSVGRNPWAHALERVFASYGVTEPTAIRAQTRVGPGGETMSVATGYKVFPTQDGEVWYDVRTDKDGGDGVVPYRSLQSTYLRDPRINLKPWGNGAPKPGLPFTTTTGKVDHVSGILTNPDIQAWIADALATAGAVDQTSDDTLLGTRRNDVLQGWRGADRLDGGKGNDWLLGGDDHDTLHGNQGNDTLIGNAGADRFSLSRGSDTITDYQGSEGDVIVVDPVFQPIQRSQIGADAVLTGRDPDGRLARLTLLNTRLDGIVIETPPF